MHPSSWNWLLACWDLVIELAEGWFKGWRRSCKDFRGKITFGRFLAMNIVRQFFTFNQSFAAVGTRSIAPWAQIRSPSHIPTRLTSPPLSGSLCNSFLIFSHFFFTLLPCFLHSPDLWLHFCKHGTCFYHCGLENCWLLIYYMKDTITLRNSWARFSYQLHNASYKSVKTKTKTIFGLFKKCKQTEHEGAVTTYF